MDTPRDESAEDDDVRDDVRIAEIRREIAAARLRLVGTIDALEYKADVPSRLADVLSATASSVTAKVLERLPSSPRRRTGDVSEPDGAPALGEVTDGSAPVPAASPLPPEVAGP